ncbi:MAG: marine proteobacterial sortase target protein [Oceanospirillales bacterium]|nr:marine proteobacterial sortase target protein [Oceanospirillales bacterium]
MATLSQISRLPRMLGAVLLLCLQVASVSAESLKGGDVTRGSLVSRDEAGQVTEMPLLDTQVKMTVTGPILRAEVTQTFTNPSDSWSEALYLFPLPNEAAVDHLQMNIGDRIVEGEIKEKEAAKATYEAAKTDGKQAALVEQDRPNLFHTSVANIPPNGKVTIKIEYQQTLVWQDGAFSLRFPLAITPRYAGMTEPARREITGEISLANGWQVLPGERETRMVNSVDEQSVQGKVAIEVVLQPGFELDYLRSPSHSLEQASDETEQQALSVLIDQSDEYKDFVLNWAPVASAQPRAAFFSEHKNGENYGLLMLMPPQDIDASAVNREVIFVIDTSGSMGGTSIIAAREALKAGINGLSSGDAFNIVEFNSSTSVLHRRAVAASEPNKRRALQFIEQLDADGGTEMRSALEAALSRDDDSRRLRQVVFITDGSVSDERGLFKLINDRLQGTRLFTVGIGSAPNSFFMEEAAVAGHGTFTYIATADEAQTVMENLFDRLAQPALTHIRVAGADVHAVMPTQIPDLYAGEPLAVAMKLESGSQQVEISGRIGDVAWSETLTVQPSDESAGVEMDWAQRAVQDWRRAYLRGESQERMRNAIVELGLKHHLVTPYTSMVAVDKTPVRSAAEPLTSQAVPTAKPHGLQLALAQGATGYQWTLMMGLVLLLVGGGLLIQLRRQAGDSELQA